jgi:hypothetical protein
MCALAKPQSYPSPKLNTAKKYGFTVSVVVKPRGAVAKHCRDIIYPDGRKGPVIPSIHLPIIMKQIKKEAVEMGFITS